MDHSSEEKEWEYPYQPGPTTAVDFLGHPVIQDQYFWRRVDYPPN